MDLISFFAKNIFNLPLICFFLGILISFFNSNLTLPKKVHQFLTIYILFCIGLKGGAPLAQQVVSSASLFFIVLICLVAWGFLQPFLSFYLLKTFTKIDGVTAAAIAASFGSVSVMTFTAGVTFLDQLKIGYHEMIVAVLAIMEIPAIISGVLLAKKFDNINFNKSLNLKSLLKHSLFNKAIITLTLGLVIGMVLFLTGLKTVPSYALKFFKPLLCLFLLDMGIHVGVQRNLFSSISKRLHLFAIYMPIVGAVFGLFVSKIMNLDVGTGTLIMILTASASYIAVPAAMRIALPQAKEGIYLPLALGLAFPFNVVIGVPVYYYFANLLLK